MSKETIIRRGGVSFLTFNGAFSALTHCFSLRHGGVSSEPYDTLNTGFHVGDETAAVRENRRRLADAVGYCESGVISGRQVHDTKVAVVGRKERGLGAHSDETSLPQTDGLVTCEPGVALMCHAADCTIIYFYDKSRGIIGLSHAGWRGAVSGMGRTTVDAMAALGSVPEDIYASLSPTIGPCCYQVGEDVAERVPSRWHDSVLMRKKEGIYFDLPELQRLLLLEVGLKEDRVSKSMFCTCCGTENFFSYRAAVGRTGRMAAVISL